MSMQEHMRFGQAVGTWVTDFPPDALEAAEMWNVATSLRVESPVGDLRGAVQSGKLKPKDLVAAMEQAAMTMVAAEKARSLVTELDFPLSVRFHNAVMAGADDMVAQISVHFEKAVTELTEAAAVLPAEATSEDVINRGGDAVDAWHALDRAAQILDMLAEIRMMLVNKYGYGHGLPRVAAYLAAVVSAEDLQHAEALHHGVESSLRFEPYRGDRRGNWAHLLRAGFELQFNTRDQALAVVASVADRAA